jgi:hypothetical protein
MLILSDKYSLILVDLLALSDIHRFSLVTASVLWLALPDALSLRESLRTVDAASLADSLSRMESDREVEAASLAESCCVEVDSCSLLASLI